jgi:hypothetical protein
MDSTNFRDFIMESDNDTNSVQEAKEHNHAWRAVVEDDIINDTGLMPELHRKPNILRSYS